MKTGYRGSSSDKAGLPPGSLVHVGNVPIEETSISVIDYSRDAVAEVNISSIDQLLPYRHSETVTWVIVEGLANVEVVEKIGEMFGVHQLKVLTVFASIFIPLTFLTGIYGMNFEYMPELKLHWAYPALWVAFITIPTVLLVYFKRRKWL